MLFLLALLYIKWDDGSLMFVFSSNEKEVQALSALSLSPPKCHVPCMGEMCASRKVAH
jgi:hypothetical protein